MVTVEAGRHWPVYGVSGSATAPFQSPRREGDSVKEHGNSLHHQGDAHRESLPSIGQLDLETASSDRQRNSAQFPPGAAGLSVSTAPQVNPTTVNHPGHHSYSYLSSATSRSTPAGSAQVSPTDTRRPGDEDKDQKPPSQTQHTLQRQSLPSIHEALGSDTLPYPHTASSSSNPGQPPVSAAMPSNIVARPGAEGPSGPPNPFSTSTPFPRDNPFSAHSSVQSGPPHPEGQRSSFASTHSQDSRNPSIPSLSSGKSPTQSSKTGTPSLTNSQSSGYEFTGSSSAGAMSSPNNYPPYSQPAPFGAHAPNGPPSLQYPTGPYETRPGFVPPWNQNGIDPARIEDMQQGVRVTNGTTAPHSESVKRQLDGYDVESSYHEIVEGCSRVAEFAGHFGAKAHQSNRSGPVVGLIPQLAEIDDLAQTLRRTSDALARIRSLAVEQALAEQQAEQRAQRQVYKTNGVRNEGQPPMYREDFKGGGGFAGGDTKKRRGKAAPPGRCHSCNRAETPEWRRGPDGARTLCNACGLHYAKLTRKAGNNKPSSLGPNLRPKNGMDSRSSTRS
ncbi:hypothetical protein EMPG_11336 [Blastomyces silverae]|uniref:GATA-type domain-containing protein n=1 Tax=Blastomyces silverae TaxID=2060906 RepID=A0A0H1BRJ6_9EURO|nr:hypothetical protein EMPG_11336 [Blastomyces silverae]